jgi:transposase
MPKGFDALVAIVAQSLKLDPLSGQLFLFFNRRCDRMKVLDWVEMGWRSGIEGSSKGRIRIPQADPSSNSVEVRAEEVLMILRGDRLSECQAS